ncbi:MAG TPA: histidine kinase dimerization/phospho-acceptor domain-containing protein, partial [Chloroflexota bacterium]|nr:histidine kinase dimerization/phospho-acceptor domain-containing protein [Chloroflexota bacterium]
MAVPHLATVQQHLQARRERTVHAWQRALARSGFVAMTASEIHHRLDELTGQIIALLLTDPPEPAAAQEIGAALVRFHYVQPEDLGETLQVLTQEIMADLPPDAAAVLFPRFSLLAGALATGFTRAARTAILEEQDAIRGALLRQRQQVQAALAVQYAAAERASSELRAVLDASSDGMLLISPERRALMVNRQFEVLFGLTSQRVIGRTFAEVSDEIAHCFVDPVTVATFFFTLAVTDSPQSFDMRLRYPEEREVALYTTAVRTPDGSILGRLHVFRDVTREREVDRMKSEFVSLVSHELRTPLTSIKGYVDLLVAGDVGPLEPEQAEFLRIVQQNADREVALITDLLDLSRMESGKLTLECRPLPLLPLLEQVQNVFRLQLAEKRQQLRLELPETLPAVWGDERRLAQV